jgi:hypothetical protein
MTVADLSIEFGGVQFKNSLWLASGSPTATLEGMKLGIDAGAGAVVAKSFTNGEEPKKQTLHLTKNCYLDKNWRPVYGRHISKFYTQYSRVGTVPKSEDEWLEDLKKTQQYASQFDFPEEM